jgi:hypothetical protein
MKRLRTEEYLQFKNQLREVKGDFELIETTYTKRINLASNKFMFADDYNDYRELKLINLTKKDCQDFCDKKQISDIHESEIDFYKFYSKNLFNNEYKHVYKVDLTSAYWTYAVNQGIISKETNDYFLEHEKNFINGGKKARLKALGSCATKKLKTIYKGGVQEGYPTIIVNDQLRNLYLNICNEIDRVMKSVSIKFSSYCIYYYWDCLFLENSVNLKDVQDFIECFGFKSKFENSVITANTKYAPGLRDIKTNIVYPIRKDDC